jgi:hypothetical protein
VENNSLDLLTRGVFYGIKEGAGYLCAQKQELWEELREDVRFILCGRWDLDQYGSSADLEETITEILDAVLCSGVFR